VASAPRRSRREALAHARDLLGRVPLVDGHNDLPYLIAEDAQATGDILAYDIARRHQDRDTDIPRLREGQVAAQVFAAFVPTATPQPGRAVLERLDIIRRLAECHQDVFARVETAAGARAAWRRGRIAVLAAVEGGVGLENSLAPLRIWRAAGMRIMTLCHNETLDWVDSATDVARHGGLTAFGRAVVLELNRIGVLVDLAHVSHDAMRQVLDISRAPVLFSHSNAFALCDHPRNVPDDVLDRVPANGGVVMATFVPDFISQERRDWARPIKPMGKFPPGADDAALIAQNTRRFGPAPEATLEQLCDHIAYLVGRVGPGHVGIGSDFYGGPTPRGLEDASRFPHLVAELVSRGWSDIVLTALVGGNALRTMAAAERIGRELAAAEPARVGRIADFHHRP
jgi:membrane dipeptidase